jgi:hydroxymethylpyrimidine/phosphomethylpyrimidine kinase
MVPTRVRGRVLVVAGSDSGGGAGVQADIKTVTALGGFAMTAVTALTAQNTLGVAAIHAVPIAFVRQQIEVVLDDLGADAVKTGMLHSAAIVEAVVERLVALAPAVPLVADPVMVAQSGASLLEDSAVDALRRLLLPVARLVTPNAPEAARLTGLEVEDVEGQKRAAERLLRLGAKAALVKGGHIAGEKVSDVLADETAIRVLSAPRIDTRQTHGTGCTLASAIATGLAQGLRLAQAVDRARAYLWQALATAPGLGRGQGPVNHVHTVRPFPD